MAERRMFARSIVDSDAFLDMPPSSQMLYFHLAMRADDDGFVNNPRKIQRMVNAGDDDMRVLLAKRFIIGFDSGVVVIKHWRIHNYIQNDTRKPTLYQDELKRLAIKDNRAYTERTAVDGALDTKCIQDVSSLDTGCIQPVSNLDAQYSLGKPSVNNPPIPPAGGDARRDKTKTDDPMFARFWAEYPRKSNKPGAAKAFARIAPDEGLLLCMLGAIRKQKSTPQWTKDNGQYIPHPATWLNQERWNDEFGRAHEQEDSLDGYILE